MEDRVVKLDEVEAEDESNARHLHTTCRIKHKEEVEETDVATIAVSQSHQ